MNQTPTENFVIFVALVLLYVQISARHYVAADGLGGGGLKGKSLYAAVVHYIKPGIHRTDDFICIVSHIEGRWFHFGEVAGRGG